MKIFYCKKGFSIVLMHSRTYLPKFFLNILLLFLLISTYLFYFREGLVSVTKFVRVKLVYASTNHLVSILLRFYYLGYPFRCLYLAIVLDSILVMRSITPCPIYTYKSSMPQGDNWDLLNAMMFRCSVPRILSWWDRVHSLGAPSAASTHSSNPPGD